MPAEPLAYFLTFTGYATWLHGDRRGSVDRNTAGYGAPTLIEDSRREHYERTVAAKGPRMAFGRSARDAIDEEIRAVCIRRDWYLHALNVRTNHVHAVVSANVPVNEVMTAFKANSTRVLRERSLVGPSASVWTRHGSTPYLWSDKEIEDACNYVVGQQGVPLTTAAWSEWRSRNQRRDL